ncbi:MAG: TolC family protein [Acidobacteriota bacterium]
MTQRIGWAAATTATARLCGFFLLVAVVAMPVHAGDSATELATRVGDGAPERLEIDAGSGLQLELEDAVVHALRHNLTLAVERYSREQSVFGIQEALSLYDFALTGDVSTFSLTRPTQSSLEGDETLTQDVDRWNLGLQRALPWGGGVSVDLNSSRTGTSNPFVPENPQYQADLGFGLRVPILRGFGKEATERNIIVARRDSALSRQDFRAAVEQVLQQVADTYWNLVEARDQLEVSEQSLELAKELHEMNRIQVEVGTMAPLEMVQSEVGVATREEEIIRRRQTLGDTEDQLRRLINLAQGSLWDVPIEPVTEAEIAHDLIDLDASVAIALDRRADVQQQRMRNETLWLDARVAENTRLPQLDFVATYGLNGLAGFIQDRTTGEIFQDTDYFDALDELTGGDANSWSFALNFAMPLENRAAKARATRAMLAAEQGDLVLRNLEDQVRVNVRRVARGLDAAAKSIESARVSSKLARKNLEAEQKRYENGLSTSFRVLEIQEDLSQALSREVTAIVTYRRALTAFQLETGQLLEIFGIAVADEADDF